MSATPPYQFMFKAQTSDYELPPLEFGQNDLEPYLDAKTVQAHYNGHHEAYKTKMNNFLKDWRQKHPSDTLHSKSLFEIQKNIEKVPSDFKTSIRNNLGGYVNHAIYWSIMSANKEKKIREPIGEVSKMINETFGNFENFKKKFSDEALKLFGSGYVWLCYPPPTAGAQKLSLISTANQDSPVSNNLLPLMVIDVWEHAYYLKHQYKRADHVNDFWYLVDWQKVEGIHLNWKKFFQEGAKQEF